MEQLSFFDEFQQLESALIKKPMNGFLAIHDYLPRPITPIKTTNAAKNTKTNLIAIRSTVSARFSISTPLNKILAP
jgi:hypothetical protein